MGVKTCRTCKQELPCSEFWGDRNGRNAYDTQCKHCEVDQRFLRRWGYTYSELVEIYGDRCGICDQPETDVSRWSDSVKRLCVDHDHRCCKRGCANCLRGLLCLSCNKKLYGVDDEEWLAAALDYLEESK